MAKRVLEVSITGDSRDLEKALGKSNKSLDKFGKQTSLVGRLSSKSGASMMVLAKGGAAAGVGLIAAAAGAKKLFDAYTESLVVQKQTETALKSTGNQAGVTAKQIGNLATAISRKSGIDDEAVQAAENLLLTFTNVHNEAGKGNKIFNQTAHAAADMASSFKAAGKDMTIQDAMLQLGKALNDPEKGMTRLTRVGVSFTDAQKKQVAAMVKAGDTAKAQKVILAELNKEFGGSAKTWGDTHPFDKLNVAWGNLQETLGGYLAPAFSAATGYLTDFINGMQDGSGAGGRFVQIVKNVAANVKAGFEAIRPGLEWFAHEMKLLYPIVKEGIGAAVEWLVPKLQALAAWFRGLPSSVQIAAGALAGFGALLMATGPVGAAIAGLVVGAILIRRNWDSISGLFQKVKKSISDWVAKNRSDINSIISILKAVGTVIKTVVVKQFEFMLGVAKRVWPAIKQTVEGALKVIQGVVNTVMGLIHGDFGRAWKGIKQIFSGSLKVLVGYVRGITAPIRQATVMVAKAVWGGLTGLGKKLAAIAANAFNGLRNAIRARIKGVSQAAADIATTVWNALRSLPGEMLQIGKDVAQGLMDGIASKAKDIAGFGIKIGKWITDPTKAFLKSKSPSKVFAQIGKDVGEGLALGIEGSRARIGGSLRDGLLFPIEAAITQLERQAERLQRVFDRQDTNRQRQQLKADLKAAYDTPIDSTSIGGSSSSRGRASGSGSNIVDAGVLLQKMGLQVAENPAFGGVNPVHKNGSYHYKGLAIDVNAAGGGDAELAKLKKALAVIRKDFKDQILEAMIEDAGTANQHLHVALRGNAGTPGATSKVRVSAGGSSSRATRRSGSGLNKTFPLTRVGKGGAQLSEKQLRQVFESAGFSPAEALWMARVSGRESGGRPGIVQYDPGDGNVGYGLTQITPGRNGANWGGPNSATYKKFLSLGGAEAMRNPLINAEMARYMFQQSGVHPWDSSSKSIPMVTGHVASAGKISGSVRDDSNRVDAIKQAKQALKDFNREQARAAKLARIQVRITGLEKIKAWNDGLKDIAGTLKDTVSQAADAFAEKWESTVGKSIDETNQKAMDSLANVQQAVQDTFDATTSSMVANGPAAQALAALQTQQDALQRAAEDASNQQALQDARRSGDPRQIKAAQDAIDETNRQRAISAAQDAAEAERSQIEAQRATERKALEDQQAADTKALEDQQQADRLARYTADSEAFTTKLEADLAAEYNSLSARGQNYASFVSKVNAILSQLGSGVTGITYTPDASAEAAVSAGPAMNVAFAPGSAGWNAQWLQAFEDTHPGQTLVNGQVVPKRASGGLIRMDTVYRVNEVGQEGLVRMPGGGVGVVPASRMAARGGQGGPAVVIQHAVIGSQRAAEAFGNRLSYDAKYRP